MDLDGFGRFLMDYGWIWLDLNGFKWILQGIPIDPKRLLKDLLRFNKDL